MDSKLVQQLAKRQKLLNSAAVTVMRPPAPKKRPNPDTVSSTPTKYRFVAAAEAESAQTDDHLKQGFHKKRNKLLQSIIVFLKERFLDGRNEGMTLQNILEDLSEDTKNTDQTKIWLESMLEKNNCVVKVGNDGDLLAYKPPINCHNAEGLLSLLIHNSKYFKGGILMDDIFNSIPNAGFELRKIAERYITLTRSDKKLIVFYNDHTWESLVIPAISEAYRSINLSTINMDHIETYLRENNLEVSEKATASKPRRPTVAAEEKAKKEPKYKQPKDNIHLVHVLEHYEGL